MLTKYIIAFFISMVPLIELRGAVPYAILMGLPVIPSYVICIIGNMILDLDIISYVCFLQERFWNGEQISR